MITVTMVVMNRTEAAWWFTPKATFVYTMMSMVLMFSQT